MGGARVFAIRARRIGWQALIAIACTWERVTFYFSTTTSSHFVTRIANRKSTCYSVGRSLRAGSNARRDSPDGFSSFSFQPMLC